MKISALLTGLLPFTALATASAIPNKRQSGTITVSYDTKYDVASTSMGTVSCSDGVNGLQSKWPTFGSVPNFPNIGGAPGIQWNSPNCGACYKLSYSNGNAHGEVYITAIDQSTGFNIGLNAMNTLTNGFAEQLGRIDATYERVDVSKCA